MAVPPPAGQGAAHVLSDHLLGRERPRHLQLHVPAGHGRQAGSGETHHPLQCAGSHARYRSQQLPVRAWSSAGGPTLGARAQQDEGQAAGSTLTNAHLDSV
ncbi:unnamed protein product [Eretmochelys imbricata]